MPPVPRGPPLGGPSSTPVHSRPWSLPPPLRCAQMRQHPVGKAVTSGGPPAACVPRRGQTAGNTLEPGGPEDAAAPASPPPGFRKVLALREDAGMLGGRPFLSRLPSEQRATEAPPAAAPFTFPEVGVRGATERAGETLRAVRARSLVAGGRGGGGGGSSLRPSSLFNFFECFCGWSPGNENRGQTQNVCVFM